jgi:(1->4)-alpha-D-glucan 1-alpha-D-glucosylmutase
VTSIAQVVVKIASPGVPDLYRGTERWFLRLVDPDNREPVDLDELHRELRSLPDVSTAPKDLARKWRDGLLKLHATRSALRVRRRHPELFERGTYVPLRATGEHADRVLAFARRRGREWAVVAVTRSSAGSGFPVGARAWGDGALALPKGAPDEWVDALTSARLTSGSGSIPIRTLFRTLPVAFVLPRSVVEGR